MTPLKKLAGQTAIYGLTNILGRVINFLLTPFYTNIFTTQEYGVVSELYAYVAFLLVFLTFGMETTLFRFAAKLDREKSLRVYCTILYGVISLTLAFLLLGMAFSGTIADFIGYSNHPEYIIWFIIIVGFDAVASIPMARLRQLNKPGKFLSVNITSILINVALNLFFLLYCPLVWEDGSTNNPVVRLLYNPEIGLGYVFISNVISSLIKILMLTPWMVYSPGKIDFGMYKKLIRYSLPLMILGMAGIANETFDRAMMKHLLPLPPEESLAQVGIYNACYKVAMLLSLGIQAFRYAAEPFIFAQSAEKGSRKIYAEIMRYYAAVAWFIFLVLVFFQDVALLLIGEDFREGKAIIPILLLAYVFFGAVFNLSFWYKLTDKTSYGAFISIVGAIITIALNILLVPLIGYAGAAWATLFSYGGMFFLSAFLGSKHFPIPYDYKAIGVYSLSTLILFLLWKIFLSEATAPIQYSFSAVLIIGYAGIFLFFEKRRTSKQMLHK